MAGMCFTVQSVFVEGCGLAGARDVLANAIPGIVLVEPPVLPVECECVLEVHLSHPAATERALRLVCTQGGQTVAEEPLYGTTGQTARCCVRAPAPGTIYVSVVGPEEGTVGPATPLLALPPDAFHSASELFQITVDAIEANTALRQRSATVTGCCRLACPTAMAPAMFRIRRSAWRSFRALSLDLASILDFLAAFSGTGVVPDECQSRLRAVLTYLVKNRAWPLAAFLLKACHEVGIPIVLDGRELVGGQLDAELLEIYAEESLT